MIGVSLRPLRGTRFPGLIHGRFALARKCSINRKLRSRSVRSQVTKKCHSGGRMREGRDWGQGPTDADTPPLPAARDPLRVRDGPGGERAAIRATIDRIEAASSTGRLARRRTGGDLEPGSMILVPVGRQTVHKVPSGATMASYASPIRARLRRWSGFLILPAPSPWSG